MESQYNSEHAGCRCSSSVELQLPKLARRVRFPSSALEEPEALKIQRFRLC